MPEPSIVHNTFTVERNYPSPRERVFAAFSEAAEKILWYAAGDLRQVDEYSLDFRVGGAEKLRARLKPGTPFPGAVLFYDNRFEDIVANERIVITSTMTFVDKRVSSSLETFEFLVTEEGTNLIFTHQGAFFPGSDGPERREAGWRALLDRLGAELAK
jgi:uncharacterized protein YndB with AHSA1/START domain